MTWGIFVFDISDIILVSLVVVGILFVLYTFVASYVEYAWMRVKGFFKGYYIDAHCTSYFTGYGYMNRYQIRYKYNWKDKWTIHEFDIQKHRIPEKLKKLEEKLKAKRL